MIKSKHLTDKEKQSQLLEQGEIPKHIAIIMDGNGRWAKEKGYPRIAGHKAGVDSVRDIVEAAGQVGVKYLTLYTFSTENWKRPKSEVSTLMRLLVHTLEKEIDHLNSENVRVRTIGDFSSLPQKVQQEFQDAEVRTKDNDKIQLILAVSYGSRSEIIQAIKDVFQDVTEGKLSLDDLDPARFSCYLNTRDIPDPDLVIRTSGEFRISNFLLWQVAYSEFFVSQVFWPDFRRKHLYEAIHSYQTRERRFGKVSEQIYHASKNHNS